MASDIEHEPPSRPAVIDSLPRVGSTSLAKALNTNPETPCLIEPFHPKRYHGHFYRMTLESRSVLPTFQNLRSRFSIIKHVWEVNGWPFEVNPSLNDDVVINASKVISVRRRNLLRRYVSHVISRKLNFWIGTKQEFLFRLSQSTLPELNVSLVLRNIRLDAVALQKRGELLLSSGVPTLVLEYEEIFAAEIDETAQLALLNKIFEFLEVGALSLDTYRAHTGRFFEPTLYRWADADLYERLPNARELDDVIGGEGFGRLLP